MAESPILIRDLSLPEAEDFYVLREAGIEYVEKLGHQLWTDYNIHDPGITILELFCYVLTDLGYRTGHLMQDILTREIDGIPTSVGDFHTAREIFSCNPVTFDDIRQMLVDIRGIRNAWILPYHQLSYDLCIEAPQRLLMPEEAKAINEAAGEESPVIPTPAANGLYQVLIEYEEFVKELKIGVDNIACVKGYYLPPQGQGITFEIFGDLIIREVSIYADAIKPITIALLNQEGTTIKEFIFTPEKTFRKSYVEIDLMISYDARSENIFHLVAKGEGVKLFAHREERFQSEEGFKLDGYLSLIQSYNQENPGASIYHFFYDWEIEIPEVLGETLVTKRTNVGLANTAKYSGKAVLPQGEGILFDVSCPIKLERLCVFYMGKGEVEISLVDDMDQVIYCEICDFTKKEKTPTLYEISLDWEIPTCQGYKLIATSSTVELFMNEEAEFPYFIPGVIILLGNETKNGLTQQYNYFFDWVVSYQKVSSLNMPDEDLTSAHVKGEVHRKLQLHRNLCEDLIKVKPVEFEEIGLYADIEFDGENAEEILAEIHCLMEEYVKPSVKFYTWQQLMEKGYSAEQVFSGPMMQHGFLDPKEFEQTRRKTELRVSDIVQMIMNIPEVKLVKNVYLTSFIDGRMEKKEPWILCLENDDCLTANFNPERSGLSLYRNNIPYQCNHKKVKELLHEKSLKNRLVKLKGHQLDCEVPIGEDQLLEDYYPMQNDLPITYLVGENRVPNSAGRLRHAQSRQLKAYLMFFEQILANFLSQMQHMPELFSWKLAHSKRDDIHTYFTQQVGEIADLSDIYQDFSSLSTDLSETIETPSHARDRKNQFLDHLLSRFAEDFSTYTTLMYGLFTDRKEAAIRLIEDKQLFIKHYPDISRNRAQGIDFRYKKGHPGLSGFQRHIYRKLGMHMRETVSLDHSYIKAIRETGKGWYFLLLDESEQVLFKSIHTPDRSSLDNLIDVAIDAGADRNNYVLTIDLDDCPGDFGEWTLVSTCGPAGKREILGSLIGKDDLAIMNAVEHFESIERPSGYEQPSDLSFRPLAFDHIHICSEKEHDNGPWYFSITNPNSKQKEEIFRSKSCESRFFVEELLEETFKVGASWQHYLMNESDCVWELYACPGEIDSLIGNTTGLFYRKQLIDLFDQLYNSEGMHMIEHILLRPRLANDELLPIQLHEVLVEHANTYDESSDGKVIVVDPYSFRMTLVLPAWSYRFHNLQFRKFAEEVIRSEVPAHIYVNIYWIGFAQMQKFEPVYMQWLEALGDLPIQLNGTHPLTNISDDYPTYHEAQKELHSVLNELQNIYPQAKLYDPATQSTGNTQPTLGNMSLGQI